MEREYELFIDAETGNWKDDAGNYWSFGDRTKLLLGTRDERLSKYPQNVNPHVDPWHGYPVVQDREKPEDRPPDEVLSIWEDTDALDWETVHLIKEFKLC